jgi:hypothetical protein
LCNIEADKLCTIVISVRALTRSSTRRCRHHSECKRSRNTSHRCLRPSKSRCCTTHPPADGRRVLPRLGRADFGANLAPRRHRRHRQSAAPKVAGVKQAIAAPSSAICRPTAPTSIRLRMPSASSRRVCENQLRAPSMHSNKPTTMLATVQTQRMRKLLR